MWRPVVLGLTGLVLVGPVVGFLLAFAVVGLGPRGNYGEMQGVAAISAGVIAAPVGALVFGTLGVWWGIRSAKRSGDNKLAATPETLPSGPAPSSDVFRKD